MSWPKEVKDEVLVKCGRHCCICHKFCGIKMELHHIVLKSEGGKETIENCIPLCFDCHSDQRSYDHLHPKGTKYTREELIGHREKWYNLVNQNLGTGTADHLEQDRALFLHIYSILPPKPTIWYLKDIDFKARKFDLGKLKSITTLVFEISYEPWQVFFDSDIQGIYGELIDLLNDFEDTLQTQTFDFKDGNYNSQCVPREWEIEQPERYHAVVNKLNGLADEIVNKYSDFIMICRKKLGVNLPNKNN